MTVSRGFCRVHFVLLPMQKQQHQIICFILIQSLHASPTNLNVLVKYFNVLLLLCNECNQPLRSGSLRIGGASRIGSPCIHCIYVHYIHTYCVHTHTRNCVHVRAYCSDVRKAQTLRVTTVHPVGVHAAVCGPHAKCQCSSSYRSVHSRVMWKHYTRTNIPPFSLIDHKGQVLLASTY